MSDMQVSDFPNSYKLMMIRAYPVIAQMDADEEYFATPAERDEAFGRILANRNLRRPQGLHPQFAARRTGRHARMDR